MSTTAQRLDELASGLRVIVRRVEKQDHAMSRLMAMGMCVGRQVEIVRQGNPLIVRLLGARIALSRRIARHIVVERSGP